MNRAFLLESLLRYSYLPVQKKDRSELPPFLSTVDFTPQIAAGLRTVQQRPGREGWDSVEYQATRFTGVGRFLNIPHPLPYARLCYCLHDNWANLDYCTRSNQSMVRPRQHPDGRMIIMDYEKSHLRSLRLSFGKRFQVKTDISNFFPSIYSHAVTWAAVGFATAKANRRRNWYNQLDSCICATKRDETQGTPIGPATSNIISELILSRIDNEMGRAGFEFIRYIDDYSAYCTTEEQAQEFIRTLSQKLKDYKLLLNIKKTVISALPCTDTEGWTSELALLLPKPQANKYDAEKYLNHAQALAAQEPDGSVLKYAVKALLGSGLRPGVEYEVLPQILNLAFYLPILLPALNGPFVRVPARNFVFGPLIHEIAFENARRRRSDGLCWALYYLIRHRITIQGNLADEVIDSRDCLAILLLSISGDPAHRTRVINFANGLNAADLYELDQYWLLLYELFFDDLIVSPYSNERAFEHLKTSGVRFLLPGFRVGATTATQAQAATTTP
jgi:hypothetical protein